MDAITSMQTPPEPARRQLQSAVRSFTASKELEERIRAGIRVSPRANFRRGLAMAAAVFVAVGGYVSYEMKHVRSTSESQAVYISSLSRRIPAIMRAGLSDHVHCTIFRKYPAKAPSIDELSQSIGAEYSSLIPAIKRHVSYGTQIIMAHHCGYQGRKYVHVALKSGGGLISLVIAKKGPGESLTAEQLRSVVVQSGISLYSSAANPYSVSAFETRDHLIYLVSESGERRNAEMLAAMGPAIQALLTEIES
jgi:hypothetical protein